MLKPHFVSWIFGGKKLLPFFVGFFALLVSITDGFGQCPPAGQPVLVTITNVTCNGGSDGTITLTVVPGGYTGSYTYSGIFVPETGPFFPLPTVTTTSTTHTYTGLPAGFGAGAVTPGACANKSWSGTITQPTAITGSATSITPACTSGTGAIDMTVSGGTGAYSFSWSGPTAIGNVEDPTNLDAGTYSVTITDANLCQTTVSNLVVPGPPTITLSTGVAIACFSASASTANLDYSGTTNSPDEYSITFGAAALGQGFAHVGFTALPGSPIVINIPAGAAVGNYPATLTVRNTTTTCTSAAVPFSVTINAVPVTSAITGSTAVCANATGVAYSVANNIGSTYAWTITGGSVASGQGTAAITVDWGAAGAGNVQVIETNNGCSGTPVNLAVNKSSAPSTSAITGSTTVCAGASGVAYSVTNNAGSTYNWVITGGSVASGQTTSSITVNWNGTAGAGNVQVTETNGGCSGLPVNLGVTKNAVPVTSAITGSATVCNNSTGVAYSVANNIGSTYSWVITNGNVASGQGTASITVDWTSSGAGNVQVTETNNGCTGAAVNLPVTVTPLPATSAITGSASVCANTNGIAYSVTNNVGSTYNWVISGGAIASGQTTASITVNWAGAGAGSVQVTETNSGCAGAAVNLPVTVNAIPVTSAITGSASVCANTTGHVYSVTNNAGSSYNWVPSGGVIASGNGTSSVTVDWGAAGAGNLQVTETNAGCTGTPVNLAVNKNATPVTSAITGTAIVCAGTNGVSYSVANNIGSTYAWTITGGGGTIASGQGTAAITIDWTTAGATNVRVVETNSGCSGAPVDFPLTVNAIPSTSAITGTASVCANTNGVAYSVTNTAGSTYAWSFTGSGTQASGTNTNSITVNWGAAGAASVRVVETNAAGCTGAMVTLPVTVNAIPSTSAITGNASVCANTNGVAYSVTNNAGSTYAWSITGGTQASGTTTNSITVNWGGAGAGSVQVIETNSGCSGAAVNLPVTINPIPVTSAISGNASVCANTNGVAYSVTNNVGSTYAWSISGGTQATGTTTNSITVNWGAAGAGTVQVIETNSGCSGAAVNLPVTINARPVPTIGGANTVCLNSTGNIYTTEAGMTNYVWSVSGGTITAGGTATDNTATVTWTSTTSPSVTVSYTNANGCVPTTATQLNVTVNPLPVPTIGGPATVCINSTGNVYTTEAGMTNYAWTVNGGTITAGGGAGDNTVTVTWTSTTTPNVRVSYTNANGCVPPAPTQYNVTVNPLPVPTIIGDNNVCINIPGNVYTTEAGMTNYVWNVVSGTVTAGGGATDNTITITWTSTTTPSVSVNYTNGNGCTAAAATVFNVGVNNPTIPPDLNGPVSACLNSPGNVYVTDVGMTDYTWNVIGGTITAGGGITDNTATITWTSTLGTSVSISYTDGTGCTSPTPTQLNVTVNPRPVPTIGGNTTACLNSTGNVYTTEAGMTNYVWSVSGGTITAGGGAGDNTATITWTTTTTPSVTVSYTDANGCVPTSPTQLGVTVNPIPTSAVLSGNATICSGTSTDLIVTITSGTGPFTIEIDNGVGIINNYVSGTAIPVSPGATTTYSMVGNATDANGCGVAGSGSALVTVNPSPVSAVLNGTATICSGASTNISVTISSGTGPFTIQIDNGVGTINNYVSGTNIPVSPASTTTYSMVGNVIDANGCSVAGSGSAVVTVNSPTSAVLSGNATTCSGATTNLIVTVTNGTGPFTINIDNGVGVINNYVSGTAIPVSPTATTTYSLVGNVVDANGCSVAGSGSAVITVNPIPTGNISGSTTACSGSNSTLTFTLPAGSYNVVYTDGTTNFTLNNISNGATTNVNPTSNTTYTIVSVTNSATSCSVTAPHANITGSAVINVIGLPNADFTGLNASYCTDAGVVTLTPNVPGGTFVGPGITGNQFNPATAGAGNHTISYIVIASGCINSENKSVAVNSVPVLAAAQTKTVCSSQAVGYEIQLTPANSPSGTVFNWADPDGAGPGTAGTNVAMGVAGTIHINDVFTNATAGPINIVYAVTPTSATGCVGASQNVTITVNNTPLPDLAGSQAKTICNGANTSYEILLNPVNQPAGTTFSWPDPDGAGPATAGVNVAMGAAGTTHINDVLANTTSSPITVTYVITPTSGAGCVGTPRNVTMTVNPSPVLVSSQTKTICSGENVAYEIQLTPANQPAGTTFSWPDPDGAGPATAGVNVAMGTAGTIHINDVLTNGTASPVIVSYVVTPNNISGCAGISRSVNITVNPGAIANAGSDQTICPTSVVTLSGSMSGLASSATWTTSGDGTFNSATSLTAQYTPGTNDKVAGTVQLTLTTDDPAGACAAGSDVMVVTIRNASDPACGSAPPPGGTGTCATVVIVPKPSPAQCTLSNGRIIFSIKPFVPALNNTGVKISIQGVSSTNASIARTNFNDSIFNALPTGTYSYSIEYGDAACTKTGQVTIDQSGTVGTPLASSINNPVCEGSSTGSLTLNVPGENGNVLEWSYDAGITDPFKQFTAGGVITGIPAGTAPSFERVISVRRNSSDPCYASTTVIMQDSNAPINATYTIAPATCNGNDGAINSITASGGSGNSYQYSIDGGFSFQSANSFTGLTGGSYILTVKDGASCQKNFSFVVSFPGFINASVTSASADCSNDGNSGSATVTINDVGAFRVAVSGDQFNEPADNLFVNYSNPSVTFSNLARGRYFVYMKSNSSTCTTRSGAIDIGGIYSLSFDVEPICNGNELSLSLTNLTGEPNTPLSINVYRKFTNVLVESIPVASIPATESILLDYDNHSFLQTADEYQIQLEQTSSLSCQVQSDLADLAITGPLQAVTGTMKESYPDVPTGQLQIANVTGGLVAYDIRIELDSASSLALPAYGTTWEEVQLNGNQQYEKLYENVPPGRYNVQIVDENGCTLELVVRVPMDQDIFIPNIFTPNDDGSNDNFFIRNLPIEGGNVKLVITNRWGKEVYSTDKYQNNWKGEGAADGIYFYQLSINNAAPITGWVEVLRGQKP